MPTTWPAVSPWMMASCVHRAEASWPLQNLDIEHSLEKLLLARWPRTWLSCQEAPSVSHTGFPAGHRPLAPASGSTLFDGTRVSLTHQPGPAASKRAYHAARTVSSNCWTRWTSSSPPPAAEPEAPRGSPARSKACFLSVDQSQRLGLVHRGLGRASDPRGHLSYCRGQGARLSGQQGRACARSPVPSGELVADLSRYQVLWGQPQISRALVYIHSSFTLPSVHPSVRY